MGKEFFAKRLTKYDEQSIAAEIRRVLEAHFNNQIPDMKDFIKHSRISSTTVFKFFGTWSNALDKAGFDLKNDMRENLRQIMNLNNGKYFPYRYFKEKGGRYSLRVLKDQLVASNWKELLIKRVITQENEAHHSHQEP